MLKTKVFLQGQHREKRIHFGKKVGETKRNVIGHFQGENALYFTQLVPLETKR